MYASALRTPVFTLVAPSPCVTVVRKPCGTGALRSQYAPGGFIGRWSVYEGEDWRWVRVERGRHLEMVTVVVDACVVCVLDNIGDVWEGQLVEGVSVMILMKVVVMGTMTVMVVTQSD